MKILVVGTWKPDVAERNTDLAKLVGYELADRGHTLIAPPSSGTQGLVAEAYKKNGGKEFIGYFPDINIMREIGEKTLIQPNNPIYTGEDYPMRNIIQVRDQSDAVLGLTGGFGTLTELGIARFDYSLPTAFYSGTSNLIDSFRQICDKFNNQIYFGENISEILNYLEEAHKDSTKLLK